MTNEEAIKKLKEVEGNNLVDTGEELEVYDELLSVALDMAIEALQGWIPCSERLPKVGENVLFTTDIYGGYVAEGDRRADGKWWQYRWNALLQNDEVTAWMPLPKPYERSE